MAKDGTSTACPANQPVDGVGHQRRMCSPRANSWGGSVPCGLWCLAAARGIVCPDSRRCDLGTWQGCPVSRNTKSGQRKGATEMVSTIVCQSHVTNIWLWAALRIRNPKTSCPKNFFACWSTSRVSHFDSTSWYPRTFFSLQFQERWGYLALHFGAKHGSNTASRDGQEGNFAGISRYPGDGQEGVRSKRL